MSKKKSTKFIIGALKLNKRYFKVLNKEHQHLLPIQL